MARATIISVRGLSSKANGTKTTKFKVNLSYSMVISLLEHSRTINDRMVFTSIVIKMNTRVHGYTI